jgi:anti-sigma-K factor RskA
LKENKQKADEATRQLSELQAAVREMQEKLAKLKAEEEEAQKKKKN